MEREHTISYVRAWWVYHILLTMENSERATILGHTYLHFLCCESLFRRTDGKSNGCCYRERQY